MASELVECFVQCIVEKAEGRVAELRPASLRDTFSFRRIELDVPVEQPLAPEDTVMLSVEWPA